MIPGHLKNEHHISHPVLAATQSRPTIAPDPMALSPLHELPYLFVLLNSMDIDPAGVAGMSLAMAGAARPTGLSAADAGLAGDAEEEVGTGGSPDLADGHGPWAMA